MALINRIALQLDRNFLTSQRHGYINLIRSVTLKPVPQVQLPENYDDKNMQLKRPQSPHLTIYAPQLTSMLSISHRFTGMALTGYTVLFGLGAVTLDSIPSLLDALAAKHVGGFPIVTAKFLLAFPFSYHFWNGIRHLFWDAGKFLTIKEVYTTGYVMLTLAVVTSIGLCLL